MTDAPEAPASTATNAKNFDERNTYHHGDLRRQLVRAVRDLIEEKGPDGFSIAEASRAAGVSTAAPYKHFKDKTAILHAVVLDGMERMAEAMRAAIADLPEGSLDRINALGQCYVDFARAQPGVFRFMFGLTDGQDSEEEIVTKGNECFGIVVKTVADYLDISVEDPKARERAYMLWCSVHGHAFLVIDDKTRKKGFDFDEAYFMNEISVGMLGRR